MKKLLVLTITMVFLVVTAMGQRYTVSGVLKDSANGETMKNILVALIPVENQSQSITNFSNQSGFYSVTAPKGRYILQILYMGYKTVTDTIDLQKNTTLNYELVPEAVMTDEVVVTGQAADHNVTSAQVGRMEMKIETDRKSVV